MTLSEKLRIAILWDEHICLECGSLVDPPAELCPSCGSRHHEAAWAVKNFITKLVAGDDEGVGDDPNT